MTLPNNDTMAKSYQYVHQFFDNAYYPIYWLDRNARIVYANKSACKELGYSHDELLQLSLFDCDRDLVKSDWDRSFERIKTGELTHLESTHKRKDGSEFPVQISFSTAGEENKDYICVFIQDITEEKNAGRQKEQLQFAVENAVDGFFLTTREGRIVHVNESACKALGYSYEELTSMSTADIDPNALSVEVGSVNISGQIYTGNRGNFETRHRRKDGTVFPVDVTFNNISFEGMEYSFSFARDLTDRKEALKQLEILRFAIDNAVDSIYMLDREARIFYANKRACRALGYSYDELTALSVYDLDPACTPEFFQSVWDEAHSGILESIQSFHRKKDGSVFPVEVSVSNSVFDDFAYSCTFARDITERKTVERQLLFTQFAIDNAGDSIFITNSRGNILYANATAFRSLGYSKEELLGMTVRDIAPDLSPDDWNDDERWRSYADRKTYRSQTRHRRKDGSIYPVEINSKILDFEGELYSCSVVRDISERLGAEKSLRDSEEKFRLIADTSPVALIIHRMSDGTILYANTMAEILFNKEPADITNRPVTSLFDYSKACDEFMRVVTTNDQVYGHELLLSSGANRPLWISLSAKTINIHGEQVVCSAILNITEAHELSAQLSYQAAYDALTGLVNRREFETRLQRIIKTAGQQQSENAMCFLDLDQFKVINDTCGHIAGDELLRQLAQALQEHIRKRDTLARLGGDEFAVLLESCTLEQAKRVANSILEGVQRFRFVWENNTFNIGVSIGLVPINSEDENITEVMKRADAACYKAKENGRNRIHVYDPGDDELIQRHGEMQMVTRITSALEQNRMQLWAQTIIPINASRNQGEFYELLLRMKDDDTGKAIAPGTFLPAAERYNLMQRLDRWVVMCALTWFARNPEKYKNLWMCSINLSGQSLGDEDFLHEITGYFNRFTLAPEKFCFEVTETAAIFNLNRATRFINTLTDLGCRFALDDFGSGLSSFAYLKNLPVDYIKIDGMFIKDLPVNPIHAALVKSINDIGHVMNKKTIAEFVESEETLKILEEMGVDFAQGYGIARPEFLIDGESIELEGQGPVKQVPT